jgi:hypothetical protein
VTFTFTFISIKDKELANAQPSVLLALSKAVNLITRHHLVSKIRMRASLPPLPAIPSCSGTSSGSTKFYVALCLWLISSTAAVKQKQDNIFVRSVSAEVITTMRLGVRCLKQIAETVNCLTS